MLSFTGQPPSGLTPGSCRPSPLVRCRGGLDECQFDVPAFVIVKVASDFAGYAALSESAALN